MYRYSNIALICLLLAACGGKQNKPDSDDESLTTDPAPSSQAVDDTGNDNDTGEMFAMPAHYAPLFEEGRVWTYQASQLYRFRDVEHEDADEDGVVSEVDTWTCTCAVEEARIYETSAATRIACEDDCDSDWISGVYIADATGLHWSYTFPEQDSRPDSSGRIIEAAPQVGETVSGDDGMPYTEATSRMPNGDWCIEGTFNDGTIHTNRACFRNHAGIAVIMSREEVLYLDDLDDTTTTFELTE